MEGNIRHRIMVPFTLLGEWTVKSIKDKGKYNVRETVATIEDAKGNKKDLTMVFSQPVKRPITAYKERLMPKDPMVTKIRIIDTFLPVAKGGTYCTPGPFGAGKTVLQHMTSKNADVDIVIIAACGERAGAVGAYLGNSLAAHGGYICNRQGKRLGRSLRAGRSCVVGQRR